MDNITLDEGTYFTDPDGTGPLEPECDPLKAGSYLCDELGDRLTSTIGYSVLFDNTNGIRATRGQRLALSQDFAGLGGDVRYLRSRANGTKFWGFGGGWVLSAHGEGGYIHPFSKARNAEHRRGPDHRPLLRPVAVASRVRHPRHRAAHPAHAL